jgi:pimeloyl-ACP methyl ester carboxylesterase
MNVLSEVDRALLLSGLPVLRNVELPLDHRPLIYFRATGAGDGIPVVMLHGGSSDSGDFRGQLAGLGDKFKMVSWCVPGYGGSTPLLMDDPAGSDYAESLHAFVTALNLDRFHLVGSSLGSVIGMCFAARYPAAVQSLTLISPNTGSGTLRGVDRENWLKAWLDRNVILDADPQSLSALLTTADSPELVRLRAGSMREAVTERGYKQIIHMMSNVDTISIAATIKCPVLMLNGGEDHLAPHSEHGAPIAKALDDCRIEILPGFGHLLQIESPAAVNRLIAEFILNTR